MISEEYVLIIEDDVFQQCSLKLLLEQSSSMAVLCAENGLQALRLMQQRLPSIIFCDLDMPEMDGIDFLHCLSEISCSIPVVIVSAVSCSIAESVVEMAHNIGLQKTSFMTKPVTKLQLEPLIDAVDELSNSAPAAMDRHANFSAQAVSNALANDEFEAYFQPKIDTASGKISSFEALARWQHPQLGLLKPVRFISALEVESVSYRLFQHILRQTIDLGNQLLRAGHQLSFSVNANSSDLAAPNFVGFVSAELERAEFPAHKLTLELTEMQANISTAQMLKNMTRLRLKGIGLSIDDFGTGISTLQLLIQSPFTELKIDHNFIAGMLTSRKHMAAVTSSIALAHALELKVVAEGVENEGQYRRLMQLNACEVQGFYFSKPVPAADVTRLLEEKWFSR